MFKIEWNFNGSWSALVSVYRTNGDAWRAVHEGLEEAFGENYGAEELSAYRVVSV